MPTPSSCSGVSKLLLPLSLVRSATWPKEVKAIASQFVGPRTTHIFIGGVEEKLVANKAITQHIKVMSSNYEKLPELQVSHPLPNRLMRPGTLIYSMGLCSCMHPFNP